MLLSLTRLQQPAQQQQQHEQQQAAHQGSLAAAGQEEKSEKKSGPHPTPAGPSATACQGAAVNIDNPP